MSRHVPTVPFRSPTAGVLLEHAARIGMVAAIVAVLLAQDLHWYFVGMGLMAAILVGAGVLGLAGRMRAPAGEEVLRDPRPPVLFLRSFTEDGQHRTEHDLPEDAPHRSTLIIGRILPIVVIFSYVRMFLRLYLGVHDLTLEQELARGFERVGPFVAIGKPGEKVATAGAARLYVSHHDWQREVDELLDRSAIVIWQAGSTEGALWELRRIRERVDPRRVVLLVPNPVRRVESYNAMRDRVADMLPTPLPAVPPGEAPDWNFVTFDAQWRPSALPFEVHPSLVALFVPSRLDLTTTFKAFFSRLPAPDHGVAASSSARAAAHRQPAGLRVARFAHMALTLAWLPLVPYAMVWHGSTAETCRAMEERQRFVLQAVYLGGDLHYSADVLETLLAPRSRVLEIRCGIRDGDAWRAELRDHAQEALASAWPRYLEEARAGGPWVADAIGRVVGAIGTAAQIEAWRAHADQIEREQRSRAYLLEVLPISMDDEDPEVCHGLALEVGQAFADLLPEPLTVRQSRGNRLAGDSLDLGIIRIRVARGMTEFSIQDDLLAEVLRPIEIPEWLRLDVTVEPILGRSTWDGYMMVGAETEVPEEADWVQLPTLRRHTCDRLVAALVAEIRAAPQSGMLPHYAPED